MGEENNACQYTLKSMRAMYSAPMIKSVSRAMQAVNFVPNQLKVNKGLLAYTQDTLRLNKSVPSLFSTNTASKTMKSIYNNSSFRALAMYQSSISKLSSSFRQLPHTLDWNNGIASTIEGFQKSMRVSAIQPIQNKRIPLTTPVNKLLDQQAKLMSQYADFVKSTGVYNKSINKPTTFSSSTLGIATNMAKLTKTMSPFLQSQRIDIASQTNKILQEISKNPVDSFSKFVERANDSSKPENQSASDKPRENPQRTQKSDKTSTSETYIDNSINITINNYQNSIDENARKHPDIQISLEYFQYLFNFIYLIFLIVGMNSGTEKAMEIISIALSQIIQTLEFKKKN